MEVAQLVFEHVGSHFRISLKTVGFILGFDKAGILEGEGSADCGAGIFKLFQLGHPSQVRMQTRDTSVGAALPLHDLVFHAGDFHSFVARIIDMDSTGLHAAIFGLDNSRLCWAALLQWSLCATLGMQVYKRHRCK